MYFFNNNKKKITDPKLSNGIIPLFSNASISIAPNLTRNKSEM